LSSVFKPTPLFSDGAAESEGKGSPLNLIDAATPKRATISNQAEVQRQRELQQREQGHEQEAGLTRLVPEHKHPRHRAERTQKRERQQPPLRNPTPAPHRHQLIDPEAEQGYEINCDNHHQLSLIQLFHISPVITIY